MIQHCAPHSIGSVALKCSGNIIMGADISNGGLTYLWAGGCHI